MHFLGRRGCGLYELRDGRRLAWNTNTDTMQPMVRLSKSCHAYLHEALDLGVTGWVYPLCWYEDHRHICGEGFQLIRRADSFDLNETNKIVFATSQIVHTSISPSTRSLPICELSVSLYLFVDSKFIQTRTAYPFHLHALVNGRTLTASLQVDFLSTMFQCSCRLMTSLATRAKSGMCTMPLTSPMRL